MDTIVKASSVTKYYGDFRALDAIDLNIDSGTITGLIGPNGAGKTTTLKALLGLCEFEGELTVAGRDPRVARHRLMEEVCFIADVGILPRWMRVCMTRPRAATTCRCWWITGRPGAAPAGQWRQSSPRPRPH